MGLLQHDNVGGSHEGREGGRRERRTKGRKDSSADPPASHSVS